MASGPLDGVKIVEFAGVGPAPYACMLLADMGADIIRIERGHQPAPPIDIPARGRPAITLDLKSAADAETALRLIEKADVLVEGFRPGVMERLGLGPEHAHARNPRLIYARMTGWGQTGPLAQSAGHDINYIALTGALHAIGGAGAPPAPPLNLVGDFGGGALFLTMGICAALLETQRSGKGQVIDCAITDCVASMMGLFAGMRASGLWRDERQANLLDGGAPFYAAYECADGEFLALGAIEPAFYDALLTQLGLAGDADFADQYDRARWPRLRAKLAAHIKTRTRAEWAAALTGDACATPVLRLGEAPAHPHHQARAAFFSENGITQPAPAPRFSRTPGAVQPAPRDPDKNAVLSAWGVLSA